MKFNRTTALSAIGAATAVAAVLTYALGHSSESAPEPITAPVVRSIPTVTTLAQLPFDHPSWEPNEETKAWALKRAYELNGNKMCCGSIDVSKEERTDQVTADAPAHAAAEIVYPNDFNELDQEARRQQVHRALGEARRHLVDVVDPPKDPCKRFHMHKVVTDGGASWKCKK